MKRSDILTFFAASAASVLLAAPPSYGQVNNCAPRDLVLAQLADSYGETRRSIAMGQQNTVVEVFASDTTGSWSITVTLPNGMMCLVSSGEAYEAVYDAPKTNV